MQIPSDSDPEASDNEAILDSEDDDVIRAIKGGERPPFRDNVLTLALQKHLEGKSLVMMFVNVSTEKSNVDQTIHSLNFADDTRGCKLSQKMEKRSLEKRSLEKRSLEKRSLEKRSLSAFK
jgi:hypothetical protein